MSEMAWYGKSTILVMCLILALSESTFALTESKWSNGNHAGFVLSRNCPTGSYVQSMQWKEQHHTGIVDLKLVCSMGSVYFLTKNVNGFWNIEMTCVRNGFLQIFGREEDGYGIVNVKSRCYDDSLTIQSNSNSGGNWNRDISCPTGTTITGMKIRVQNGYGIINFQPACSSQLVPTIWSNDNHEGTVFSQRCPSGHVVGLQWKEQDNFGIVDLSMICALGSGSTGSFTFTKNPNGFWNDENVCLGSGAHSTVGYSGLVGREEDYYGIVNVRSKCYSDNNDKYSNGNEGGNWNRRINCPTGQNIVGMSIREELGFGIINFMTYCGNVSI